MNGKKVKAGLCGLGDIDSPWARWDVGTPKGGKGYSPFLKDTVVNFLVWYMIPDSQLN